MKEHDDDYEEKEDKTFKTYQELKCKTNDLIEEIKKNDNISYEQAKDIVLNYLKEDLPLFTS